MTPTGDRGYSKIYLFIITSQTPIKLVVILMFKNNYTVSDVFSNVTYTPSCGLTEDIDMWTAEGTIQINDTTDFEPRLSIESYSEVSRLSFLIGFYIKHS